MSTHNDITGDRIISRASNEAYRNNKFWDKIDAAKEKHPDSQRAKASTSDKEKTSS